MLRLTGIALPSALLHPLLDRWRGGGRKRGIKGLSVGVLGSSMRSVRQSMVSAESYPPPGFPPSEESPPYKHGHISLHQDPLIIHNRGGFSYICAFAFRPP
jgi:hypothetical protein